MQNISYSNYSISAKCQAEETKGRFVVTHCLNDIFNNYTITTTQTSLTCPVDIKGTISSTDKCARFNVEVKQRNKSEEQLLKYPTAELRVDKYNRMLQETPNGTALLYCILLNQEWCYVFNLKKLDWSKVSTFTWKIKRTQVDPNSPYDYYPTYSIPLDLAVRKVPCSEYFKLYEEQLN